MSADTIASPACLERDVRRSRFLAHAVTADSPDAALSALASLGQRDASHNCWAYRIGDRYRFSDDGEPAGTAGRPILAAIEGQGFDHVFVVVTRWFGGVKLGAGGLVRAYGGTAAECLRLAPRRALVAFGTAWLQCAFADVTTAHALLAAHGGNKLEEHYDADGVRLRVRVPAQHIDALAATLRDATRGRAGVTRIDASDR
ncbi:YigZ family protein [Chiayiivirga flava]|uniref:Putative YigZ family protein n=1 Tax=Chiayiivirga flava TaxID=659595 RepID=A0A7W8FZH9_9GAMM|nr:putative YigZ family protein [Chiayiivirga flava]